MSEPTILAVGRAFPRHYADQETLLAALRAMWSGKGVSDERLEHLHRAVKVRGRHLALPIEEYGALDTFEAKNAAWTRAAVELGERAARDALERAGISPGEIDHVFFVTVTGIATPSVDALLVSRLGLRADVKRTPIFGLGCVAGAAGIARAADYLRGFERETALLLSVELCTLTLQKDDLSVANLIASGLFGDGAAAVVLAGGARGARGPRVRASRSVFYPDSEDLMGWEVRQGGFRVVLSARVPELVRERLRGDVDSFLAAHGLDRGKVRHWIAHTGGPRVLEAVQEGLELPAGALGLSWRSLETCGNLSSASVLLVLGDLLESRISKEGENGLLFAMGPGFCSELVLLEWPRGGPMAASGGHGGARVAPIS